MTSNLKPHNLPPKASNITTSPLAQSVYLSVYDANAQCLRRLWQSGHTYYVSCNGDEHLRSGIYHEVFDVEVEAGGHAIRLRVLRERVLRLGNADGESTVAQFLCLGNLAYRLW